MLVNFIGVSLPRVCESGQAGMYEETNFLNRGTEPLRSVAVAILDAGLRPDECFRLRWENIRFVDAKRAVIVVPATKTTAARPVPTTPRVRAIIAARWKEAGEPATGWDAWTLARLAGHSSIRQSMTYVHPSDNALHAAINNMSNTSNALPSDSDGTRDSAQIPVPAASAKSLVASTKRKS
jgi:integrase